MNTTYKPEHVSENKHFRKGSAPEMTPTGPRVNTPLYTV